MSAAPYSTTLHAPGLAVTVGPAGPMVMIHLQHPAGPGVPAADLVGYLSAAKAGELVDALIGALTVAQEWRLPAPPPRDLSRIELGHNLADELQRDHVCPAADVVIPAFLRARP